MSWGYLGVGPASILLVPALLTACAARDLRPDPGLYLRSDGTSVTLRADGTFSHQDADWGVSRGLWWVDNRRVVLQAGPDPVIEGFGRISPTSERVPIQILDREGRPQGAWARFYEEGVLAHQSFVEDGQLIVSRYLPFDGVEICATRDPLGQQRGPLLRHDAFHDPYAAYRITVDLGRPFDAERWRIRRRRLVQPARYSWRRHIYTREEREREIIPDSAVAR